MADDPVERVRSRARLLQRLSIRYSVAIVLLAMVVPIVQSRSPEGVLIFGPTSLLSWTLLGWTVGIVLVTFLVWRQSLVIEPLVRQGNYEAARKITRSVLPFSVVFGLVVGVVVLLLDRQLGRILESSPPA